MIFKSLARTETAAVVIKLLYSFFILSDPKLRLLVFRFFRIWAPNGFVSVGDLSPPLDRLFTSPSRKGVSSLLLKRNICPAILSSDGFRQLHIMLVYGSLVRFLAVKGDFLFCNRTYQFWGASSLLINGYMGIYLSPQVKRSRHEVMRLEYEGDNSLPSSVDVEKGWSCTASFPHAFIASTVAYSLRLPIPLKRNWT